MSEPRPSARQSVANKSEHPPEGLQSEHQADEGHQSESHAAEEGHKSEGHLAEEGHKSEGHPAEEGHKSEGHPAEEGHKSEGHPAEGGHQSEDHPAEAHTEEHPPEDHKSEHPPEGRKSEHPPEGRKSEHPPDGHKSEHEGRKSEHPPDGRKSDTEGHKSERMSDGRKSGDRPSEARHSQGSADVMDIKRKSRDKRTSIGHPSRESDSSLPGGMREGRDTGYKMKTSKPKVLYENSFRLEPAAKFQAYLAEKIIQQVLTDRLHDQQYIPEKAVKLAEDLAINIKEKIRELKYDRYKLVVVVFLGLKANSSLMISSESLSDAERDTSAVYTYETMKLFATCIVYAVNFE